MPIYDYNCPKCHKKFEQVSDVDKRYEVKCPKCSTLATKLFTLKVTIADPFRPYWSENMSRTPTYIDSRSTRQRLMKEKKIDIMPDRKYDIKRVEPKKGAMVFNDQTGKYYVNT